MISADVILGPQPRYNSKNNSITLNSHTEILFGLHSALMCTGLFYIEQNSICPNIGHQLPKNNDNNIGQKSIQQQLTSPLTKYVEKIRHKNSKRLMI